MCECKRGYMCQECVKKVSSLLDTIQKLREQYGKVRKPEQQLKLAVWIEMVGTSIRATEAKSRAA